MIVFVQGKNVMCVCVFLAQCKRRMLIAQGCATGCIQCVFPSQCKHEGHPSPLGVVATYVRFFVSLWHGCGHHTIDHRV